MMVFATEIINNVAKKAKLRLIIVIILVVALIISNVGWGYAYSRKCRPSVIVAYTEPSETFVQAQNIKRKGVPRKASGYEKM